MAQLFWLPIITFLSITAVYSFQTLPDSVLTPSSGTDLRAPISKHVKFPGTQWREYYYLQGGFLDTILMRTDRPEIYVSHDAGNRWLELVVQGNNFTEIFPHTYKRNIVFLLTDSGQVQFSTDQAANFQTFFPPTPPTSSGLEPLAFHPAHTSWLLWFGQQKCPEPTNRIDCTTLYISKNFGTSWENLLSDVHKCRFVDSDKSWNKENLIYCERYEDDQLQLLSSDTFFRTWKILFAHVIPEFVKLSEYVYIIVPIANEKGVDLQITDDGLSFYKGEFPSTLRRFTGISILPSPTHCLFALLSTGNNKGAAYGTLIKDSGRGTPFVSVLPGVNRIQTGEVDFERINGLEGIIIINIVSNLRAAIRGEPKKLKTKISFNDGADWRLIPPPSHDADGRLFGCSGAIGTCSLHLHGRSESRETLQIHPLLNERLRSRSSISSLQGVGIAISIGNVGESLTGKEDAHTFMTRDGGVTWTHIAEGEHMWAYGGQGSLTVISSAMKETNHIKYSVDEGLSWKTYQFTENPVKVVHLSTDSDETSRNFIVWSVSDSGLATIAIDFSALSTRNCNLPGGSLDVDGDFYSWIPFDPLRSDRSCLFGRTTQYLRKKPSADCYNPFPIPQPFAQLANCSCSNEDFECDRGIERNPDRSCSPAASNLGRHSIISSSGRHRIPINSCHDVIEADVNSTISGLSEHRGAVATFQVVDIADLFIFILLLVMLCLEAFRHRQVVLALLSHLLNKISPGRYEYTKCMQKEHLVALESFRGSGSEDSGRDDEQ